MSSLIPNWQCHVCTFINKGELNLCEMCATRKKINASSSSNDDDDTDNEWKCNICTFSNISTSNVCKICGVEKMVNDNNNNNNNDDDDVHAYAGGLALYSSAS